MAPLDRTSIAGAVASAHACTDAALVTWHPSPISASAGRVLHAVFPLPGETLRHLLTRTGIDPHALIVVTLDGELIKAERWDCICPRPGQIIAAQATVAGGDGSNPLRTVLSIAVMVFAWYYAPALMGYNAGAAGWTAAVNAGAGAMFSVAITSAAINIAGSMVLNAVFPTAMPNLSDVSGRFADTASSPTYSLSGGSNRLRPYEPLPVLMGRHRMFPDYGAKTYTEYSGDDQYLYQIFNFGLADAVWDDFRIGETPLSNYSDVETWWSDSNGRIPQFPGNIDTAVGANVTKTDGPIVRRSSTDAIALAVDIEVSLYSVDDSGIAAASCTIMIEYRAIGEPDWLSMIPQDVVSWGDAYWSLGVWVTENFPIFGDGYTRDVWYQRECGSTTYTDHVDGSSAGYPMIWRWRPYAEILSSGNGSTLREPAPPQPRTVTYTAEMTLSNATTNPVRKSYRIDVALGQYDVRVSKLTDDATSARLVNAVSWSSLRTYQADASVYPEQRRLGMRIRASGQLNGVVQQFSAIGTARCLVWSDPDWVTAPSRSPAWWYLDFAFGRFDPSGRRTYGCGLDFVQIDLDAIKSWAAFCAQYNLTLDAVFDRAMTAADVLQTIARCGLASPSWATGKLGVVWDAPNQPEVGVFSMSNILQGTFSVDYITERLADEIIVTYVNPENDWKQDQVRVLVPGTTSPERPTTVELMGCTSQSMAALYGNLLAAQQVYRRRRMTWEADFEGFVARRGDVMRLSHDLTQWGYSGRLVAVAGAVVTLDRAVPRSGANEYFCLARPDGSMTTVVVLAGVAGVDADTLSLATALQLQAGFSPVEHKWLFSPLPTPGKKVKIISTEPISESRVRVIATDEESAFYAAWYGDFQAANQETQLRDSTPKIESLSLSESLHRFSAIISNRMTARWTSSSGIDHVRLRWRANGSEWTWLPSVYGASEAQFDIPDTGLIEVEATPAGGIRTGQPVSAALVVFGKTLPPADVPWFSLQDGKLSWGAVGDIDLAGYEIRWHPGALGVWWRAQPLHTGLLTASPWPLPQVPVGTATLLIKAIDTSRNESINAAAITTSLGDPIVANVITSRDLKASGFPGLVSGASIIYGNLVAISTAEIWNPAPAAAMWSTDDGAMWDLTYYAAITYRTTLQPTTVEIGTQMTIAADVSGESWRIDYRHQTPDDAPMWDKSATLMWSGDDSAPMRGNAPGWMPWPGAITAELGKYEIRVQTAYARAQGSISALTLNFDVPDLMETLHDVSISASGTRLSPNLAYHAIRAVNLTVQDDGGSARTARVIDKSKSGPLIKCYDAAYNATAGKVDAIIQGY